MSAQIRRANDRSKIVEQESGRRLYATDLPYEEAMDQTSQKYLDTVKLVKQSENKKPYAEDDYSAMEYKSDFNVPPWKFTPINPGGPDPGCKPKCLGAWGSVGSSWEKCKAEKPGCSAYLFECCSRIARFFSSDLNITGKQNLENDQCVIYVCSAPDKDSLALKFIGPDGKIDIAKLTRECCPQNEACAGKCDGCPPPTIGYISQQMACSGTQVLTHSGGGAGGVYTWSTDYGTFSAPSGNSVTFTAPAANAECAYNPTITLTDCCGHTGTLKIAVNCNGAAVDAAQAFTATDTLCYASAGDNCTCIRKCPVYRCDNSVQTNGNCGAGVCGATVVCTQSYPPLVCSPTCSPVIGVHDNRTSTMKSNGCCPAILLDAVNC